MHGDQDKTLMIKTIFEHLAYKVYIEITRNNEKITFCKEIITTTIEDYKTTYSENACWLLSLMSFSIFYCAN